MITLLAAILVMMAMGLLLQASVWCVPFFLAGGVLWIIADTIDDDLAFLGGCFLWIFFAVCSYVIFRQFVIWMTDLIMWMV